MKGNIIVLTVSRIMWSLSMSVVFPYQSLYSQELGGSEPVMGMMTALGSLVSGYIYEINPMHPWHLNVVFMAVSLFLAARLVENLKPPRRKRNH